MEARVPGSDSSVTPEKIGRLFDAHARALVLYARQLCVAASDVGPRDVVQEAFMKLAEQRTMPRNPLPWLYRVVRNDALMAARSRQRRKRREVEAAQNEESWFQQLDSNPAEQSQAVEALAELAADQREIITAHIWGGLSFREIGELIGVSASAAHRRYQKSLQDIRHRLGVPCHHQT